MEASKARDIFFMLGRPFGPVYSALMRLRAALYAKGFFTVSRLPVPVVSVGNLTMGGTGKTPMVIHLARLSQTLGFKPAIVSRGYGGRAKDPVNIVSDGERVLLPASLAGDEPRHLAESLPGVPVITSRRRVLGAQYAVTAFGADLIVLDDGFQHLALARDLDIVLFRADAPLGNGRVFPGGDLREPLAALSRADCCVVTGTLDNTIPGALGLPRFLQQPVSIAAPLFAARYRPHSFVGNGQESLPIHTALGPVLAFCGLAQPEAFQRTLAEIGCEVTRFVPFPDHHPYTAADCAALCAQAGKEGVAALVTTEKDLVKMQAFACSIPLYAVRVELVPDESCDAFLAGELTRLRTAVR